jgi:hypothetical protein
MGGTEVFLARDRRVGPGQRPHGEAVEPASTETYGALCDFAHSHLAPALGWIGSVVAWACALPCVCGSARPEWCRLCCPTSRRRPLPDGDSLCLREGASVGTSTTLRCVGPDERVHHPTRLVKGHFEPSATGQGASPLRSDPGAQTVRVCACDRDDGRCIPTGSSPLRPAGH